MRRSKPTLQILSSTLSRASRSKATKGYLPLLSTNRSYHYQNNRDTSSRVLALGSAALASGVYLWLNSPDLSAKEDVLKSTGRRIPGLPEYGRAEVEQHKNDKNGLWVTFGQGVYDVTKLAAKHPAGAEFIQQSAGGPLEPYFNVFPVHKDNEHVYGWLETFRIGNLKEDDFLLRSTGQVIEGLPVYRKREVSEHADDDNGIWVTFGHGVYDITDFIPQHPGAKNILMAAGGPLEPFWNLYAVHLNSQLVYGLLERYRIGNLHPDDAKENAELAKSQDPFLQEPKTRSPALVVNSLKPFNAETPLDKLADHFLTPNDLFYVRNHLPTPDLTADEYELEIAFDKGDDDKEKVLKIGDVKKFPKVEVVSAIQCGGNRRAEMNEIKPIKGLMWKGGAIGNAKWGGARLKDVLEAHGFTKKLDGLKHVQFEGYDCGSDGTPYGASIPLSTALDGDVLLAYEMNGEVLPRDHGYPIRLVAPGIVGARNVKWLKRIVISDEESHSHWQRNDYKSFNPSVDWTDVDFAKSPSIQSMPVTSVICYPQQGSKVTRNKDGTVAIKGYAWSGGGAKIIRVDLTCDGGKTWQQATLDCQDGAEEPKHYGWTLWSANVKVPKGSNAVEVWSKAVDSNHNLQPEDFNNIWNLRGMNSNAYSKLKLQVK